MSNDHKRVCFQAFFFWWGRSLRFKKIIINLTMRNIKKQLRLKGGGVGRSLPLGFALDNPRASHSPPSSPEEHAG